MLLSCLKSKYYLQKKISSRKSPEVAAEAVDTPDVDAVEVGEDTLSAVELGEEICGAVEVEEDHPRLGAETHLGVEKLFYAPSSHVN